MRPLIVLSLLCGCATPPPPAPEPPPPPAGESVRDYFPLTKGNRWRYQGSALGTPVDFEVVLLGQDGPWFVDNTGERYRVDAEGLRSQLRYLLKGPLVRGARWRSVVSTKITEHYEITGTGVLAEVPAGRYLGCVTVRSTSRQDPTTTLVKEDTYCPDVGLVRIRTWVDLAGKGMRPATALELVSFARGGGAS